MPDNATTAFSLIGIDLDVNTLFMVTMHVEIILGLLLFFAWAQNFNKRALAWWGSAHLMRAVSIMLLGLYGRVPDSLSIDFANAVLFSSFALTWCGARVSTGAILKLPSPWSGPWEASPTRLPDSLSTRV